MSEKVTLFDTRLASLSTDFDNVDKALESLTPTDAEAAKALGRAIAGLRADCRAYASDCAQLLDDLAQFAKDKFKSPPVTNEKQHFARKEFDSLADRIRSLIKQIDLLYKLATRIIAASTDLAKDESFAAVYDRRAIGKLARQLEEQRKAAVEQLKLAAYFHRQIAWLQDRFPSADIRAVPGLVKVVTMKEIASAEWKLSPGHYVGIAQAEVDEDFDFEQTITNIHSELTGLNDEAVGLAKTILKNFEELGV